MKKSTDALTLPKPTYEFSRAQRKQKTSQFSLLACYATALIVCFLVAATPLARLAGTSPQKELPTSPFIIIPGQWLPLNLGFNVSTHDAEATTHVLFFLALIAISFVIYGCAALLFRRRQNTIASSHLLLRLIACTALLCGTILMLTPALLSHDIFSYSTYGRILGIYHANPYFVLPLTYPQDPFYGFNNWRQVPSAYGPIWLVISAGVALLCGNAPANSILAYQGIGLALHLLNTFLVIAILHTQKQSDRIVVLGALLYAWNPLILVESCSSGHNDTLMITFILLSFWLFLRAEALHQDLQLRPYLLSLLVLSCAILVKFSAAPMLVLLLSLLARRAVLALPAKAPEQSQLKHLLPVIKMITLAALFCGAIILALYGLFWIGGTPQEILYSFSSQPSVTSSYGSILRALQEWIKANGLPQAQPTNFLFTLLSQRTIWNDLNILVLGAMLLLGVCRIWRAPTPQTLLMTTLMVLGSILLITPWFFPWYVTWLIALAAAGLASTEERLGRALIGSALASSVSAFCIYLYYRNAAPIGGWIGFTCLTTLVPPLATFLLLYNVPAFRVKNSPEEG